MPSGSRNKRSLDAILSHVTEGHATSLELSLRATGTPLTSRQVDELCRRAEAGELAHIEFLDLEEQTLGTKLLTLLAGMPSLQRLDLAGCRLGALETGIVTDALEQCSSLTQVILSDNELTPAALCAVVASLAQHTETSRLHLTNMGLDADGFHELAQCLPVRLQWLLLDDNAIGDAGLDQITKHGCRENLTRLFVRSNGLTASAIQTMASEQWPALKDLVLSDNPLRDEGVSSLAHAAHAMPNLEVLEVDNCELTDASFLAMFAAVVSKPWCGGLRHIWIARNDFRIVPEELLTNREPRLWREYLALFADDRRPVPAAKVVLLGEGGVGKTHLRRRVFDFEADYYNPHEPRTADIGMGIGQTHIPVHFIDTSVNYVAWDFGGQRHLHSTHRLFMAPSRTAYIIVCDATRTRQENQLDYWIRFIQNEASHYAPIVISVTKCDLVEDAKLDTSGRLGSLDAATLKAEHGVPEQTFLEVVDGLGWGGVCAPATVPADVRGTHHTSIQWLHRDIHRAIWQSPALCDWCNSGVQETVAWFQSAAFTVNDALSGHISRSSFDAFCGHRRMSESQRQQALQIAHDAGMVYDPGRHRQLRRGEPLAECLFNPSWLCGPVYRLIGSMNECRRRGRLSWSEIELLLPEHGGNDASESDPLWRRLPFTASDRVAVVDLMCEAGVLFPIGRGLAERSYLVPDHLDKRGMSGPPAGRCWMREFDWLSEASFARVLGRLCAQLPDDPATHWRDEITIPCRERASLCLRLIEQCHREKSEGGQFCSILYASVVGGSVRDAVQTLNVVDVALRDILGEPMLGTGSWEPVGSRRGDDERSVATAPQHDELDVLKGQLSADARLLFDALVEFRNEARVRGVKEHAWQAKYMICKRAHIDRHGQYPDELLQQLLDKGLILERRRGSRCQYRAVGESDSTKR